MATGCGRSNTQRSLVATSSERHLFSAAGVANPVNSDRFVMGRDRMGLLLRLVFRHVDQKRLAKVANGSAHLDVRSHPSLAPFRTGNKRPDSRHPTRAELQSLLAAAESRHM